MIITPAQARAARALLNLTQGEVAKACNFQERTLSHFENEVKTPQQKTLETIHEYYTQKRIVFNTDDTVGKKPQESLEKLSGTHGFRTLMDDVRQAAEDGCCIFRIQNARPENWEKHLGEEWYREHAQKMIDIAKARPKGQEINFKITSCEGDPHQIASGFAEYRWAKKEEFEEQSIYIYADKVAFLFFDKNPIEIDIIRSQGIANTLTKSFDSTWKDTLKPSGKVIKGYE